MPDRAAWPWWAIAASLVACDATYAEPVEPEAAVTTALDLGAARAPSAPDPAPASLEPAPIEPSPELAAWLREAAVDDETFARRRLYTWISTRGAEQLRVERQLFDDAQLPEGPTPYVQRLEHEASTSGPGGRLARLLLGHPDLRRRRYAWTRPWATRRGMVREYGDQLVEVVLRPDAIVGRFDPSRDDPWRFRDLDGRPIPVARILADPSRVGAIFHVRDDGEPRFREFVVCNPAMVESWALATPAITTTIADDARFVRALADDGAPPDYATTIAFDVPHYEPSPANLDAVADALDASVQHGPPLVVRPRHTFDLRAEPSLVRVRSVPPKFFEVV